MPDEVPRSAVESAIHAENQAAAKQPEQKGLLEGLRELWGVSAETLAGHGVKFLGEQLGKIGEALEHMGKDALAGAQHAYHTSFYGTRDFGHTHDQPPSLHDNAPVVSAIEQPKASFEDIMRAQAEMAPERDEPSLEHQQGPDR